MLGARAEEATYRTERLAWKPRTWLLNLQSHDDFDLMSNAGKTQLATSLAEVNRVNFALPAAPPPGAGVPGSAAAAAAAHAAFAVADVPAVAQLSSGVQAVWAVEHFLADQLRRARSDVRDLQLSSAAAQQDITTLQHSVGDLESELASLRGELLAVAAESKVAQQRAHRDRGPLLLRQLGRQVTVAIALVVSENPAATPLLVRETQLGDTLKNGAKFSRARLAPLQLQYPSLLHCVKALASAAGPAAHPEEAAALEGRAALRPTKGVLLAAAEARYGGTELIEEVVEAVECLWVLRGQPDAAEGLFIDTGAPPQGAPAMLPPAAAAKAAQARDVAVRAHQGLKEHQAMAAQRAGAQAGAGGRDADVTTRSRW